MLSNKINIFIFSLNLSLSASNLCVLQYSDVTSNGKPNGAHKLDESNEAETPKAKSKEISEETEESKSIN